jgi:hypothetical protein
MPHGRGMQHGSQQSEEKRFISRREDKNAYGAKQEDKAEFRETIPISFAARTLNRVLTQRYSHSGQVRR